MIYFFQHLLDPSDFPARWNCGIWDPAHGWLHILSDAAIWGAYMAIPIVLIYFARNRRDIPFPKILWLFAAFIFACGTTHLVEAFLFWYPVYRFSGLLKLITAVVSWATVIALVDLTPKLLNIPGVTKTNERLLAEVEVRKKAELHLREARDRLEWEVSARRSAEKRLRDLYDHAPDPMASVDLHTGIIQECNVTLAEYVGCSREQLLENSVYSLYPDDMQEFARETMKRLVEDGEIYDAEMFLQDSDGNRTPVFLNVTALRNEEGKMVSGRFVWRDSTELFKAREDLRAHGEKLESMVEERTQALRLSEERYHLAVSGSNDGVWDWHIEEDYCYFSPYLQESLELSDEDCRRAFTAFLDHIPSPEREQVRDALNDHIKNNAPYDMEFPWLTSDGEVRWMRSRGRAVRDAEGKVLRMVGTMTQTTERHDAQEYLQETLTELQRSNDELEQFAYIASHDLQEPLRKIRAFGDRLQKKHSTELGAEGSDYIDRMQSAAKRMQSLIEDLLAYSRAGRGGGDMEAVNLAVTCEETVSTLMVLLEKTGGRVEIGDLPTIHADPSQMRQLFQNLIGNGLKFHREGVPPVVMVRAEEGPVLSSGMESWKITFQDNGIGFEEKYADRIFQPFQRLHGRNEFAGTGIGLAICRKIVERHGGYIETRSVPGEGTELKIILSRDTEG